MAVILATFVGYEILGGQIAGASLPAVALAQAGSVFSLDNLAAAAFLFFVFFLVWVFSGGKGVGLGDAKLAGLIGLVFGFWNSAFILYLAVIAGALVGLALILSGRGSLKTKLPLGAFISFSAIFFTLFGYGVSERVAEFFKYLLFRINLF